MSTLFHTKNSIISYNISSSPIDHYKKTVAIPLLDSLIIQMQDRFSDKDRHARHLLCLVQSIIVKKALQLDDEVEGMLFWEKDIQHSGGQQTGSFNLVFARMMIFQRHLSPSGHCLHPTDQKLRSCAIVFTNEMNQDLL